MIYIAIAIVLAAAIIASVQQRDRAKPVSSKSAEKVNIVDLMQKVKKFYGASNVAFMVETQQGHEYRFAFYTQPDVNGTWFLKTGFFNICADYFTLENELRLIDDMGIEKASTAYDKGTVEQLLDETGKAVLDTTEKEYYTNMLLELRSMCKAN